MINNRGQGGRTIGKIGERRCQETGHFMNPVTGESLYWKPSVNGKRKSRKEPALCNEKDSQAKKKGGYPPNKNPLGAVTRRVGKDGPG